MNGKLSLVLTELLFVYLFTNGLFNVAASRSDSILSSVMVINE